MHLVEPYFAFYDSDFALFTVIRRQAWPLAPGQNLSRMVRKLSQTEAEPQQPHVGQARVRSGVPCTGAKILGRGFSRPTPTPAKAAENQRTLDAQIARAVAAVAKLRARGVPVLFLREPSTGEYLAYEQRSFPRASTWDVLLAGPARQASTIRTTRNCRVTTCLSGRT